MSVHIKTGEEIESMRVAGRLGAVEVPDGLLETDVRFVDVLRTVQIAPVGPFPVRREPLIARPSVSMRPLDLSVFTFSAMPYLRNVVIT